MITVKFKTDYRGVLTKEAMYRKGDTETFPQHIADRLIADGRAKEVKDKKHKPESMPEGAPDIPLEEMTLGDLRELAIKHGIDRYWQKKRETLIAELAGVPG